MSEACGKAIVASMAVVLSSQRLCFVIGTVAMRDVIVVLRCSCIVRDVIVMLRCSCVVQAVMVTQGAAHRNRSRFRTSGLDRRYSMGPTSQHGAKHKGNTIYASKLAPPPALRARRRQVLESVEEGMYGAADSDEEELGSCERGDSSGGFDVSPDLSRTSSTGERAVVVLRGAASRGFGMLGQLFRSRVCPCVGNTLVLG